MHLFRIFIDIYKLILFILTEKPANANDAVKFDNSTQNNELKRIFYKKPTFFS